MTSVALLLALWTPLPVDDKEADEALKAFGKAYANPSVAARAAAVTDLARVQSDKIMMRLAALVVSDDVAVRKNAALGLGGWTENKPKVAAILVGSLGGPNAKEYDVQAAIFAALGKLAEESALPTVHKCFEDRSLVVAKAAIESSGAIRSRASIEVLIEIIKDFEKINKRNAKSTGGGGVGLPGGGNDPQSQRAKDLMPVAIKAMASITTEKYNTGAEWMIWWDRNREKFKVPPPPPPKKK